MPRSRPTAAQAAVSSAQGHPAPRLPLRAPAPGLRPAAPPRAALTAAAAAPLLLVPAAKSDTAPVTWSSPTPADHSRFSARAGSEMSFSLSASTTIPDAVVHIAPARALPKGAAFKATDGTVASGTFSWRPRQAGDYSVRFAASTVAVGGTAPTLTFSIHVTAKVVKAKYPQITRLTDDKIAHWAPVWRRTVVRAQASATARRVTTLDTRTSDGTQNLVLVLTRED